MNKESVKFCITNTNLPTCPVLENPRILAQRAAMPLPESCKTMGLLQARDTIFQHIGWGKDTAENQVEQGGLLLGKVFRRENGTFFTLITQALPAEKAEGSMKHLHFSHRVWEELLEKADLQGKQVVGWYHTHPRYLRMYMSETDLKTQASFFYEPWHIAMIFNPQRIIQRSFLGATAAPLGVAWTSGFLVKPSP